ncbi:unnamed protein product [Brugia timori]|uniref:Wsv107 n=1 Tax=Brugia timori TaxID=42155 RepID=A0A0R3QL27_9BILA|nr:unnamed protein product [Brugia timori]
MEAKCPKTFDPIITRFFSWLTVSRSQSDVEEMESSLDISFEFFARSPTAEVELTKTKYERHFFHSQIFRHSILLLTESPIDDTLLSSSSLADNRNVSKQTNDSDSSKKSNGTVFLCEEKNEMAGSKIPDVPFVPKTIFSNFNSSNATLGTYEVREKILKSLKQRVPVE